MSFFKKLFGGSGGGSADGAGNDNGGGKPGSSVEHEGFTITPTPMKEGGQFRLAGTISMDMDGEVKSHKLIRADVFTSADECEEACIRKAKQVIKEQGKGMFR
ncbi:MAG: HlyU family transcriptional regulator [Rhizobiaceae bacterium]